MDINPNKDTSKIEISLCMIAKDEELVIQRSLICANQFCDELILVDTGSSDRTTEIASLIGVNVYDFKWINDFSAARNYAFSLATKDYIFWMDADDYITPENIKLLQEIKKSLNTENIDVISMNYALALDCNGKVSSSLRRNRLVKRANNYKWVGKIHEYLEVFGNTLNSNVIIHHGKVKETTNRNLEYFNLMKANNHIFSLRDTLYYGNELFNHKKYKEAAIEYEKFLKDDTGWIEDIKTATSNLVDCYKALNESCKIKEIILKCFKLDIPRADICCKLAHSFMDEKKYTQAIFWYKIAMECIPENNNLGYNLKDYYTWVPSLQLCLAYSLLENFEEAYYYNELSYFFKADLEQIGHNRTFLQQKFTELSITPPLLSIIRKN